MEVTEILPPNRLGKNAVIDKYKKRLLSQINLNVHTRNKAIRVFFLNDYAERIQPQNSDKLLAVLLNDYFSKSQPVPIQSDTGEFEVDHCGGSHLGREPVK